MLERTLCALEEKRADIVDEVVRHRNIVDQKHFQGRPLRDLQEEALIGFSNWLNNGDDGLKMGHIVAPNGVGKTGIAALLTESVPGKAMILCWNRALAQDMAGELEAHYEILEKGKSIGRVYSGQNNPGADITVSTFHSQNKWENEIDWDTVDLLIVDEADVNGLSAKRDAFLKRIAREHGVIIVGMSATESQASGKQIQDTFPDQIIYHPIPKSLQTMHERGHIPDLNFRDLALDLTYRTDGIVLRRKLGSAPGVSAKTVGQFMHSTSWNNLLLEDLTSRYGTPNGGVLPTVVVYRNNLAVNDMVQRAQALGINARAYTGEITDDTVRRSIITGFNDGEIDMIVGSHLPGRGMNVPRARIGYNCMFTFSSQLFWQALRVGRTDDQDPNKQAVQIAVTPRWFVDHNTGFVLPPALRPLCHATFFDPEYFDTEMVRRISALERGDLKRPSKIFHLNLSDVMTVRSNMDVAQIQKRAKHDLFTGRHVAVAHGLRNLGHVDGATINWLKSTHQTKIRAVAEISSEDGLDVEELMMQKGWLSISREEEFALYHRYYSQKNSTILEERLDAEAAIEELIRAFDPIFNEMAKRVAYKEADAEDLAQEARLKFLEIIDKYSPSGENSGRLITYALIGIYRCMTRAAIERPHKNAPKEVHEAAKTRMYTDVHVNTNIFYDLQTLKSLIHGLPMTKKEAVKVATRLGIEPAELHARIHGNSDFTIDELTEALGYGDQNKTMILLGMLDGPVELEEAHHPLYSIQDRVERIGLVQEVDNVLTTLTIVEELVLRWRFGLTDMTPEEIDEQFGFESPTFLNSQRLIAGLTDSSALLDSTYHVGTLEWVGQQMQTTRERIRQIEAKALRKLRHPMRSNHLVGFVGLEPRDY